MRSEKNFVVHQISPVALSDLFIASLTQLGCLVIFFLDMCNANWLFKSTFRRAHHLRCQNSPMMLTPYSQCSTALLIRCATSPYQTGANGVQHRVGHVADRRLTKKRGGGEGTSRRTRSCGCLSEQTGSSFFPFTKGPDRSSSARWITSRVSINARRC